MVVGVQVNLVKNKTIIGLKYSLGHTSLKNKVKNKTIIGLKLRTKGSLFFL